MNYKKLLLTLTLCLCALLCMVVTASASEMPVHTNHFSCGVADCQNNNHGHTPVTEWQPWTGPQSASEDNIPYDSNTKTAYIYLADNVQISDALTIPQGHTLYLCLNGHDIIRTGNLIQIQEDASFTLCDCKGDKAEYGKLDSNKGGRVVSFESGKPGTFTMYGGIITGGNVTGNSGGGVFVGDKNTFTMYGGTITNGTLSGGVANNFYLPSGTYITITDELTGSARIGVTTENTPGVGGVKYVTIVSSGSKESLQKLVTNGVLSYENKNEDGSPIGLFTKSNRYSTSLRACSHDFSQWAYSDTQHWKKCANCDAEDAVNKTDHSGGTATCTEKAVCTTCGQQYGNTNPNNHDYSQTRMTPTYKASDATCTTPVTYYYSCVCGATGTNTFNSTKEDEQAKGHAFAAAWEHNDDKHWHKCTRDGCTGIDAEAAHEWQPATYTAPKTCTVCGATTGTKLSTHYYYSPAKTEDTPASPKAGDPGVLLYAGLALASLTGLACTAKKRH